jgi:hypothetical protein
MEEIATPHIPMHDRLKRTAAGAGDQGKGEPSEPILCPVDTISCRVNPV